jgi:formylglycine-generating enzyme required for sulfatase activity
MGSSAWLVLAGCLNGGEGSSAWSSPAVMDGDTASDSDPDTNAGSDTGAAASTCVEGESAPNADAPADYTAVGVIEMIGIPSGSFCMGSDEIHSAAKPIHAVTLTRPFWLGRTEVSQAQYEAVTGETPSYHAACDTCPVEWVTWHDATIFANALSAAAGLDPCYEVDGSDLLEFLAGDPYACTGYRLPTEAEWEYAGRAGEAVQYAGSNDADNAGWTSSNSGGITHDVAGLTANAWGLYDMTGNVWEYTNDWYDADYCASSPSSDPVGGSPGSQIAVRGGAWETDAEFARVAVRARSSSESLLNILGFRLARTAQ